MYFFRNILCLFICLDFGFAFTQTFNRTYGGTGTDRGNATIQAIDGNYLVAGSTTTSGAGGSDVYLIKNSPSKLSYWAKTFGGTGNDIGYSVARVSDGGYVIAGSTDSFGAGGLDVYLIKTDSNGGLLWSATFGGVADDAASCVIETADGGFAITGYTSSYGGGLKDVYLIKTNSDATSYWTKVFGAAGPYDDEGHSIIEDSNGDFVIAGYTRSFGSLGNDNGYIIKTNSSGTPIWSTVIGGANSDILYDIVQNTAGGYLAVGATKSLSWCNTGYNNYLVRIDNAGSVIEDLVLGWDNDEVSTSVIQLPTGSFVIAGYTRSFGAGLKDVLLYQFTFSPGANTVNWYKAIGGTGIDEAKSVVRASDGTLIVAGTTASFGAGGDEVFHINASSLGISSCNSVGTPFLSMCVDPLAVSTGTTSTTGGSSSSGGSTSNTSPVV